MLIIKIQFSTLLNLRQEDMAAHALEAKRSYDETMTFLSIPLLTHYHQNETFLFLFVILTET